MHNKESFKKQLLLTYLLIGTLNVLVIFFFNIYIHSTSSETLIKRAEAQMTSVRSMTSAKLVLYFQKLKLKLIDLSEELSQNQKVSQFDPSLVALWRADGTVTQLLGPSMELPKHDSLKEDVFYPYREHFLFKSIENGKTFVWLISREGISDLFDEREGLGASGEVYLVGKDSKIKSASRHIKDWSNTKVDNLSVAEALKKVQGVHTVEDYRKVKVVSAFSNFEFDEIEFALLSEIDLEEVLSPLDRLLVTIYALSVLLLIINLVFSLKLSRKILKIITFQNKEIQDLHVERERSDHENALKVFRAQEDERERISFSLHDSVGQYLTVLKWGLAKLKGQEINQERQKEIDQLSDTCNDIIQDIRDISHDLMPTLIRDFGVCSAVKDYLEKQNLKGPIKVSFVCPKDLTNWKFKKDFEVNLYRMVQELYQNNIKHSHSKEMEIEFTHDINFFSLRYKDNGVGMAEGDELPYSISYRAKLFDGKLERLNYDRGLFLIATFSMGRIRE